MLTRRRIACLISIAVAAIAFAVAVHFAVEHYTTDPPNYTYIDDGIWLGGFVREPPPKVHAVLNLCEREDPYVALTHRWEPIRDAAPPPSLDWLRAQIAFIEGQRQQDREVFVHCQNGASRSGMVVVAYFMTKRNLSREEAFSLVRARRSELRPNSAFMDLLAELERAMR